MYMYKCTCTTQYMYYNIICMYCTSFSDWHRERNSHDSNEKILDSSKHWNSKTNVYMYMYSVHVHVHVQNTLFVHVHDYLYLYMYTCVYSGKDLLYDTWLTTCTVSAKEEQWKSRFYSFFFIISMGHFKL